MKDVALKKIIIVLIIVVAILTIYYIVKFPSNKKEKKPIDDPIVEEKYSPSILKLTTSEDENYTSVVYINVNIEGEDFDYFMYEDNKYYTNVSFEITKNDLYAFILKDKHFEEKEYDIEISKIDDVKPLVECSGYYKDGNTYVTQVSSDNTKIDKVIITKVDDKDYNKEFYSSSYVVIGETHNIEVKATDIVGNTNTATCTMTDKNTYYPAKKELLEFKASNGLKLSYWLYVPEGMKSNQPFLMFLHGDGEVGNANSVKNLSFNKYIMGGKYVNKLKFAYVSVVAKEPFYNTNGINTYIKELTYKIAGEYQSNMDRLSIMGFSGGAIGAWRAINAYPDLFYSGAPISCCTSTVSYGNFKHTKIRSYVGSKESYATCMKSMVDGINKAGGNATLSVQNGQSHSTMQGYLNQEKLLNSIFE